MTLHSTLWPGSNLNLAETPETSRLLADQDKVAIFLCICENHDPSGTLVVIFKIFFCEKTPMNVYILDWHVILLCIQEIELGNKLWTSPLQGTESFPFTLKWMEFEVNRQHHHLSKYRLSSRYSTLCILWSKYITLICSACFLNRKNVCQEWDVCRVFTLQHVLPGSRAHNMLKI